MNNCGDLKALVELGHNRRRLGAELGHSAPAVRLGTAGGEDAVTRPGRLRHGTIGFGGVLSLQAKRRPRDRVQLQKKEQCQNNAHTEL